MDAALAHLIRLQRILIDKTAFERYRDELPVRIAEARQALERLQVRLAEARSRLEEFTRQRRQGDGELTMIEEKISRYKGQLLEVKTNREYTALQEEIRAAEQQKDALEERVIEAMEAIDELEAEVAELEAAERDSIADAERRERALEQEVEQAAERVQALAAEQVQVEQELPREILAAFRRIANARDGIGVVPVVNYLCQGCRVRVRPQVCAELRSGERLHQCGSCRRFLYYAEATDAAAGSGTDASAES